MEQLSIKSPALIKGIAKYYTWASCWFAITFENWMAIVIWPVFLFGTCLFKLIVLQKYMNSVESLKGLFLCISRALFV